MVELRVVTLTSFSR